MFLLRCGTYSENELNPTENETMVETKKQKSHVTTIHSNLGNKIVPFKIVRAQIYSKIR